jgi:hypothetical protein
MEITMIISGIIIALVSAIAIAMTIKVVTLRQKIKLLVVSLATVQDIFNDAKSNEKDNDVHTESFIKFLSDSRDWAYKYIEDVQESISSFVSEVEPEIAYFDEYGLVGDAYPHYHSMKKISKAYKDLKKVLPDEGKL